MAYHPYVFTRRNQTVSCDFSHQTDSLFWLAWSVTIYLRSGVGYNWSHKDSQVHTHWACTAATPESRKLPSAPSVVVSWWLWMGSRSKANQLPRHFEELSTNKNESFPVDPCGNEGGKNRLTIEVRSRARKAQSKSEKMIYDALGINSWVHPWV